MELYELGIFELREKLKTKEVSAREVLDSFLARVRAVEEKVGAFITVCEEEAKAEAEAADQALAKGEDRPLLGIPVGVKDILLTKGVRTTAGSRILENFIPPYDATAVEKLKAAGAVILGKLNLDEFAMGSSTENSAFKKTRNPWALDRVPGGSSGGSAAAVAAGECPAALGTDTGGSIRQPAAFCGVAGLKPTYGRVSRFGVIAFASSLDQVGPIAGNVKDTALLFQVIAGHDPKDSTSVKMKVPDCLAALNRGVKGLKIGIPREYFAAGLSPEVEAAVKQAAGVLEKLGAELEEVSLPHTDFCVACYYIIAPAEASSNLARYDGVRYGLRAEGCRNLIEMYNRTRDRGFGPEVKRRILIGTYTLSAGYYDAYYRKASQVRTLIKEDFAKAFEKVDLLLAPATPKPAFKLGEMAEDPLSMYLSDILTISCNLAGLPGMSIPCGFTEEGLPVGLQLIGKPFDEETVFAAAYAYEQETGQRRKRPEL